ncbi:MAG: ABC transporter substrate-binding protein [Zoogloeaceae bacterium]|jgi:sulfonate transport system substrate-binding protein|nr:ABC transporter substrate-binding protein [Zoogloeaceae bacterium]
MLTHALATALLAAGLPLRAVQAKAADLAAVTLRISSSKDDDATFFADAGVADTPYKVRYVRLRQASLGSEALNAGSYDFGAQSNISSVFLPPRSPVRLAGFVGFAPAAFKVYVRRGSGITSTAAIKGRRIGYMRGGPLHLLLIELLKQEKLTLDEVRPIALSAHDSASAFLAGDLDVVLAGMFAPSYQIEQGGGEILVLGDHYPAFARNNGSSFAAHTQTLADPRKCEAIADYLRRLQQTWQWLDEYQDRWAARLAKLYGVPPAFIVRHRPRPRPTPILSSAEGRVRLRAVADAFFQAGAIPALPDLDRLWSPTLDALLPKT